MLKLLIDACVSPAVTRRMRASGHDATAVLEMAADPGDQAILERAAAEGRTIITIDTDFGTLVFRDRVARVGVVRLRESPPNVQAERAEHLVRIHGEALEQGAFVVDDGSAEGRLSRRP